jgi:hypothetical protein
METIFEILLPLIYTSAKISEKLSIIYNCKTLIGHEIPEIKEANKAHDSYGTKFL